MDTEKIKAVIDIFENSKISTMDLETGDMKIKLEKNDSVVVQPQEPAVSDQSVVSDQPAEESKTLNSPLVGVFYASSAPGKAPFVEIGSSVKKGDVVCIVEAMKAMNEIKAGYDGTIKDILVSDGDMVEYDQPLMVIGD